jgi:PAS domain S-box-containing protein
MLQGNREFVMSVRERSSETPTTDQALTVTSRSDAPQGPNHATEELYGYSPAETVGSPVRMLMPPNRVGEERELLDRVLGGEALREYETVRVRKDGRGIRRRLVERRPSGLAGSCRRGTGR